MILAEVVMDLITIHPTIYRPQITLMTRTGQNGKMAFQYFEICFHFKLEQNNFFFRLSCELETPTNFHFGIPRTSRLPTAQARAKSRLHFGLSGLSGSQLHSRKHENRDTEGLPWTCNPLFWDSPHSRNVAWAMETQVFQWLAWWVVRETDN